jgi:hypothetical protein
MAHIPANAKWWLADLVVEFIIEGQTGNVVHYNLTLIRAESAEQAYDKAVANGKRHEATYTNTDGERVTVRFRGLREMTVIYDELEDGAELLYEEGNDLSQDQVLAAVKPKEKLAAFAAV